MSAAQQGIPCPTFALPMGPGIAWCSVKFNPTPAYVVTFVQAVAQRLAPFKLLAAANNQYGDQDRIVLYASFPTRVRMFQ